LIQKGIRNASVLPIKEFHQNEHNLCAWH
jgi:hypothetical protein